MKLITFKTDKTGITIKIPRILLNYIAKHNPDSPLKINNSQKFLEEVAFELENGLGDPETGLTGFQELIDEACQEVSIITTTDCCEFIEFE